MPTKTHKTPCSYEGCKKPAVAHIDYVYINYSENVCDEHMPKFGVFTILPIKGKAHETKSPAHAAR